MHLLQVGVVNPDMTAAEAGSGPRGNNGLRNGIGVLQCFIPGVQLVRSGSVLAARVTAPSKPKKKTALAPVWRAEGASLLLGGAAQFAAFGQQCHAVHQVLHGNDAHQAFTVDHRYQRDAGASDFGQCAGQCLLAAGNMKDAVHGGLHVAVALGCEDSP